MTCRGIESHVHTRSITLRSVVAGEGTMWVIPISGVCCYDDPARRVRHHQVDLKLRRTFGRRRRGKLKDDAVQPVYILTARGDGTAWQNHETAETKRLTASRHTSTRHA